MGACRITMAPSAKRDLKAIPLADLQRIRARLSDLAIDPLSGDVKKLAVGSGLRRLRVGRWRVIFRFEEASRTIQILHVLPRGSAYRDL